MKTVVDAVNELRADVKNGKYTMVAGDQCYGHLDFDDEGDWVSCVSAYFGKVCTVEEFNQCVAEMSEAKWIPESKPVFTQAMADAVELPPIDCYYLDEDGQLCLCIGYSSEKGFVVGQMVEHPSSNGYPPISTSEKTCVKPIKTEREKAIDEIQDVVCSQGFLSKMDVSFGIAEALYDANYRKLTPSQAKACDDKTEYFGEDYK